MATTEAFEEEQQLASAHDPRSGFCLRTGTYSTLVHLGPRHRIPTDTNLDAATFVLSHFPSSDRANAMVALVDSATGRSVTYSQLRNSALALAAALHYALGVRKGDVILLLSPNSLLYPAICLGVLAAGAAITTANPLSTAAEVAKQACDSGASLAIVAPDEAHKLESLGMPIILTARSDSNDGSVSVEELMEAGEPSNAPVASGPTQSDVAAVLYSSGTTGMSKGVLLTHGNLIAIISLLKWAVDVTSAWDDIYLGFLPMFHVYGLAFFALGLPCVGATTVVMPRFDLHAAMEAVARHRVSNIPAVPPVLLAMLKGAHAGVWDLSSLRRVASGAAPMGAKMGQTFRSRFPWVELRPGYGLTESGGAATFFVEEKEAKARPGAVGRLMPGFEAKVVEVGSGRVVGPGGEGELWLRGPSVMKGYLGNQEATAAALDAEGWLRTGDLVYFDEDGYLYIVDRIKELIKHNGYQVAPAELEAVLLTHPNILDAAVIPLEDEEAGQIPIAYVVRSAESGLTSEIVIQFVAGQVAPYKKIKRVSFINAIPRSAAGKILRKQLVAQNQGYISTKL